MIDSRDLFLTCVKHKAQVTSLIEKIAPETPLNALEEAIRLNRVEIVRTFLA